MSLVSLKNMVSQWPIQLLTKNNWLPLIKTMLSDQRNYSHDNTEVVYL